MTTESPHMISYLMAIAIVTASFTISKIFAFGIRMTLTLLWNGSRSNINMSIERQCVTSYLTGMVIFLSITIFKIFTDEICNDFLFEGNSNFTLSITILKVFTVKMCMTLTLTFRMGQCQM